MSDKIVQINEEVIKRQLKELVRGSVEETLNELPEKEAETLTQAARYERNEARRGYRSGHYDRRLTMTSGDVTLHMPRLKEFLLRLRLLNAIAVVKVVLRELLSRCIWQLCQSVELRISQRHSGELKSFREQSAS